MSKNLVKSFRCRNCGKIMYFLCGHRFVYCSKECEKDFMKKYPKNNEKRFINIEINDNLDIIRL